MEKTHYFKNWEPIDFTVYFSFIKWLVIAALVLEIIFRLWADGRGEGFYFTQMELVAWVIRLAVWIFLGWRSAAKFGRSSAVAVISGLISGAMIGLAVAIFRFFDGIQVWNFFNLITETVLSALAGGLVIIVSAWLFNLKKSNS